MQIIFVLAEYIPHAKQLGPILATCDQMMEEARASRSSGPKIELRLASAALCGYAMHERTMLKTDDVRRLIGTWHSAAET